MTTPIPLTLAGASGLVYSVRLMAHHVCLRVVLSHGQAAAGDQVKTLCLLLRAEGCTVWYDNEMMNRSTEAMEEGVRGSSNVVLFLSGDPVILHGSAIGSDAGGWLVACWRRVRGCFCCRQRSAPAGAYCCRANNTSRHKTLTVSLELM